MIKKTLASLLTIACYATIHTSDEQITQSTATKNPDIDKLYVAYKQEHQRITLLLQQLTPLIEHMPTLPVTKNAQKTYCELKKQHDTFAWYLTYSNGWKINRRDQHWDHKTLETLIELKKADHDHLQTIFNSLSKYNNTETNYDISNSH